MAGHPVSFTVAYTLIQRNASVRTLALRGLRQRHPQATEAEIQRRLADILLGAHLAQQVYDPLQPADPE